MTVPDLVVLFADADAQRFVSTLIERGIERKCLRAIAWTGVRDPMHDARGARQPTAALGAFLRHATCRFAVVLDKHGAGQDNLNAQEIEAGIVDELTRAGVEPQRVIAIAFEPELEVVLLSVWPRVLEELGKKRGALAVTSEPDIADPKASFTRALQAQRLKATPPLFAQLAAALSLERLKEGAALRRLGEKLVEWFWSFGRAPTFV